MHTEEITKPNINSNGPKWLLGGTIALTYILLIVGNLVTTTDSGLDCPDWPLCHGTINPPKIIGIWIEWSHRLLGGVAGVLIIISSVYMFKVASKPTKRLLKALLGLIITVVLLGGVVVLMEAPLLDSTWRIAVITTHTVIATVVFVSMIIAFRATFGIDTKDEKLYSLFLFALIYIQIVLGVVVRYSSSSLACPDWPLCQGSILPPSFSGEVLLHYTHRIIAYSVAGLAVWRFMLSRKTGNNLFGHTVTLAIVAIQILIGVMAVLSTLSLPFVVLHGAVGFLLLGWIAYQATPYLIPKSVEAG